MGLDPKSTEKKKVNVWTVVALMMGVVGFLGGPEKGEIGNMWFITAGTSIMRIWAQHFESLATSGVSEWEELRNLVEKMQELTERSKENEEYKLDVAFTAEEVEHALSSLKRRKVAGPEGLMAEHLQEAGGEVQIWMRNALNAIVELEVPSTLKSGIIIPVYKSSGRHQTAIMESPCHLY